MRWDAALVPHLRHFGLKEGVAGLFDATQLFPLVAGVAIEADHRSRHKFARGQFLWRPLGRGDSGDQRFFLPYAEGVARRFPRCVVQAASTHRSPHAPREGFVSRSETTTIGE